MESFNNSNNDYKRTIALGMPPLPPRSERMEGQSSQNPNTDPQKLNRTLAIGGHGENFHTKEISRIMLLEWRVKSLEANVQRDSKMIYYWKQQHHLFQVENDELKQKLSFCSHEIESKEAEYVELNKEKDELKEVYVWNNSKSIKSS